MKSCREQSAVHPVHKFIGPSNKPLNHDARKNARVLAAALCFSVIRGDKRGVRSSNHAFSLSCIGEGPQSG
jgi:hypothetical protein